MHIGTLTQRLQMDLVVPLDQGQCMCRPPWPHNDAVADICVQEYFAEVDEDYILDRFNLTGLNGEVVQEYQRALDLITDSLGVYSLAAISSSPLPGILTVAQTTRPSTTTHARRSRPVRGSCTASSTHATLSLRAVCRRWCVPYQRSLVSLYSHPTQLDKYRKGDFGRCPRVYCYSQPLLPVGLTDIPYQKAVKLYCPRCEDIYSPKSNRHGSIDGAYFGTTFPHMLFMAYPQMIPSKGQPSASDRETRREPAGVGALNTATAAIKAERYEPKIFGFRAHEEAELARWRQARRDAQIARLEALDNPNNL